MSERASFLQAISAEPDDDTVRLAFADWLQEQGEARAAARVRWWCRVRLRLWDSVQLDGDGDHRGLGRAISEADDWRWRLGSLAAIWTAECYFTPHLNPAAWPEGWSAERFLSVLHQSRSTIEAVALGALPTQHLTEARRLADEASGAARGLVAACPQGFHAPLGPWVQACEVLHMAERTVAITKDWATWESELMSEGGIAGQLMQATASAFEILLGEPSPDSVG